MSDKTRWVCCDYVSVIKNNIAYNAVALSKDDWYLIVNDYWMGRCYSRTQESQQLQ